MKLRGIDTNLVVALAALLEERSVTRAAKRLGLGQSSTSHTLARLRAHFGDPLLVQVGRSMVLTERAKELALPVNRAVADLEKVFTAREAFDPKTSDRVFRIVAPDNLELYVLPKLAAALAKAAPRVSLRVHQLSKDWPDLLRAGEIDLKLGRRYRVGPELRSQDLLEERFTCVVSKKHPLAKKKLTLAQYAKLRHLMVTPTANHGDEIASHIDTLLAAHGHRRHIALTVAHFVVAPFIVAQTDLSLTTSERLVQPFVDLLKLEVLDLPLRLPTYRLSQVWAARSDGDPAHAWLRSAIANVLA